jgi:hypothetical protein
MLDLNHLPKTGNGNIDYFYNTGGTAATFSWVTWEKPKGIGTIVITCIGGGGGGVSGWCADAFNRSGGGSGASGSFTRVIIPAMVLPDFLYIQVGKGGAGGASATTAGTGNIGAIGTASYVSIAPSPAAIYTVCYANAGGSGSISASSSSGGTAASVAVQTSALMSGLGQFFALLGQNGVGSNISAGNPVQYPTTGLLLSGGASGGGNNSATVRGGGNVTAPTQSSFSVIPTRNGGPGGTTTPGDDGISLFQPLMSIGGAGGSSSNSSAANGTPGGRGGHGGIGCGGGGGGAGPSVSGSGAGGNGGDGLVIIQTF